MSQLKREDWLERSLMVLAEEGLEALTIDKLCQKFAVTKGSFYHHFKHRHAFLEALLEFWEESYTSRFIAYSQEATNPIEQLERLHALVVENFGAGENVIRAWAQSDPLARIYQERVDRRRLDFLYEIQLKLHQEPALARSMAHLQYATLIGSSQIFPPLSAEDLQAMYQVIARFVLAAKDNSP